jgi:FkbM family methyltransferase
LLSLQISSAGATCSCHSSKLSLVWREANGCWSMVSIRTRTIQGRKSCLYRLLPLLPLFLGGLLVLYFHILEEQYSVALIKGLEALKTTSESLSNSTAKESSSKRASPPTAKKTSSEKVSPPPPTPNVGLCPRGNCTDWKEIRNAWHESLSAADEAEATVATEGGKNQWTDVSIAVFQIAFKALVVRDPDRRISTNILDDDSSRGHEYDVVKEIHEHILKARRRRQSESSTTLQQKMPVMIDIGASNSGYLTAVGLSLGARVISFEPMRASVGPLLATVRANGWRERSYVYHNAVSHEPALVRIKSINSSSSLSNRIVTESTCSTKDDPASVLGQYGVDWMEAVTLDQVVSLKHIKGEHAINRIDVLKIDVESFEVNVIEGAIRTLCHIAVDAIILKVEYIKNHKLCDEKAMHTLLEKLGFSVQWGHHDYSTTPFKSLPPNVMYVQKHPGISPTKRLAETGESSPCRGIPRFEFPEPPKGLD